MSSFSDDELDRALESWQIPTPSPHLEEKVLRACRPSFHRFRLKTLLTMQVTVPLPAAVVAIVILFFLALTIAHPGVKDASRRPAVVDEPVRTAPWGGLQPVAELRARLIRGQRNEGR